MDKNYTIMETSYNVDFAKHNYAVVHLETVNNGDVKRKTECFNKFYEAKKTFENLVELEYEDGYCPDVPESLKGFVDSFIEFVEETSENYEEEEVSEVKWMDKEEIIARIKNNFDGITDKVGCWEYLVKYYEWRDKK